MYKEIKIELIYLSFYLHKSFGPKMNKRQVKSYIV